MAWATAHPDEGTTITNIYLGNSNWRGGAGWVKKEYINNCATVHYVYNTITGGADDFKFKWNKEVTVIVRCINNGSGLAPTESA